MKFVRTSFFIAEDRGRVLKDLLWPSYDSRGTEANKNSFYSWIFLFDGARCLYSRSSKREIEMSSYLWWYRRIICLWSGTSKENINKGILTVVRCCPWIRCVRVCNKIASDLFPRYLLTFFADLFRKNAKWEVGVWCRLPPWSYSLYIYMSQIVNTTLSCM